MKLQGLEITIPFTQKHPNFPEFAENAGVFIHAYLDAYAAIRFLCCSYFNVTEKELLSLDVDIAIKNYLEYENSHTRTKEAN